MKKIVGIIFCGILFAACGGGDKKPEADPYDAAKNAAPKTENANPSYDPKRGEGKFTKVELDAKLNTAMAASGEKVFGLKCSSCHKLTEEKLVGPGWKGVTARRTAEWVMNFVTNTDAMIDKDPEVQAQLEICLVRMPNQNLADEEARSLYEYMRQNDGVK